MHQISDFLNRPYPEGKDYKSYLLGLLGISVFITLFLFAFKPFNLHQLGDAILPLCIGFGVITFVVSLIYDGLIKVIFNINRSGKGYTLGKWIAITMGLILVIGITNYLVLSYILGFSMEGVGSMIFSAFLVGLFPLTFLGSYAVLRGERKYGAIAKEIELKDPVPVSSSIQLFDINSDDIRYIEAMQNYVRICYVADGALRQKVERNTLSSIETGQSSLERCHRSYIVNTSSILEVSGNAQGLQLTLEEVKDTIPVSRKYLDAFR